MEFDCKMEKLHNEYQWSVWKFKIKLTFIVVEAFELVTGIEERPTDIAQIGAKMRKWRKLDFKAQYNCYIILNNAYLKW